MREIEVEVFLDQIGTGVSRPVIVLGDDFNEYILKNEKVDENGTLVSYNSMFVNELLSYQIGCYLGVPMPESVIAIVDSAFAEDDPTIRFAYRFEKGKYFATKKLKYIENNLEENYFTLLKMGKPYMKTTWKKFFKDISNKEQVKNILAFDIFIANFDRYNNEGNILIDKSELRKIYAIDHGHAFFGPVWNKNKVNCLNLASIDDNYIEMYTQEILKYIPGSMFNSLEEYINLEDVNNNPFDEIVSKIMDIDEEMVELWMNNIPTEWYVDKDYQIAYYKKFILNQKEVVKYIIQNLAYKNAFSNYKGGVLKWSKQKQKFPTVL
ncbi:HipA family kinase [Clostridium butyricum]|uniref:HipA family kinase n=1 Tax=Clostridium butyricum TaxID=1492 RepID=UPI002103A7A8|nr:HipA family kinase [Clostridium butyricum]MCQ2014633.1 hypothetical protein [Clostridium butyricum]MCQ2026600.1 hypothetical protein [Clostridium butyricum]